jgi:Putative F0F1-ATPase subunit Ca2+/Mg2+ transporter
MESKKKPSNNVFIQFTGLGLQLFALIYGFHFLGVMLDKRMDISSQIYSKLGVLLGLLAGLVSLILQLKRMNK